MSGMHGVARVMRWTAGGLGLLAVGYATVAGTTWYRYGRVPSASPDERDPLLDQFMPEYEVAERHHVRVAAPAAMTLSAAADSDLQQSTIVRVIFRARELVLGARPDAQTRPKGLSRRRHLSGGACWRRTQDARSSLAPSPNRGCRTSSFAVLHRRSFEPFRSRAT